MVWRKKTEEEQPKFSEVPSSSLQSATQEMPSDQDIEAEKAKLRQRLAEIEAEKSKVQPPFKREGERNSLTEQEVMDLIEGHLIRGLTLLRALK